MKMWPRNRATPTLAAVCAVNGFLQCGVFPVQYFREMLARSKYFDEFCMEARACCG